LEENRDARGLTFASCGNTLRAKSQENVRAIHWSDWRIAMQTTGRAPGRSILNLILALVIVAPVAPVPKVKPEEVVAHYLESLGPAAVREGVKSRIARGTCHLRILEGGTADQPGKAMFVSEGQKSSLDVMFNYNPYPLELVAFDGDHVVTPYVIPGSRSRLGDFAFVYGLVLREGLLGGPLSTASPLPDVAGRKALLDYNGIKKIDGRELHQIEYRPRKGAPEMTIHMYFEPDTFHHVKTVYDVTLSPGVANNPDDSARLKIARFRLEETFGDYSTGTDGLTLPKHWTIKLTSEPAQGAVTVWQWEITFTSISQNGAIDASLFNPH
jgi:hypothetical protein